MSDDSLVQYGTRIDAPLVAGGNINDDWPVAFTNQLQGAVQQFKTKADMNTWSTKYKSRVFNSIAVVGKGENNYPSIYHWTGTKKDGSDGSWEFTGYFGGVVLADADGAIPALRATIVLGDDFQIEEAGDNGLGALVQLSSALKASIGKGGSGGGLINIGTYQQSATFGKGDTLELEWPLKAWPDADKSKAFRVSMDHGAFEGHHAEGYLAYFDWDEVITGVYTNDHAGYIWADKVAYGSKNVYIYGERSKKSVVLQETDTLDPNVTGGTPILCAIHIGFVGKAPNDGIIKAYLMNRMNNQIIEVDGQPVGIEAHYKQGQDFEHLTFAEIYPAKGMAESAWRITHTFSDDPLKLEDWIEGESCVLFQAMGGQESIGPALNQFQIITGKKLEVEKKYYGPDFFSSKVSFQAAIPEMTVGANTGMVSNLGITFLNPTPLKASISGGQMHLTDDGTHMGYFMYGDIVNAEDTKNLRGKEMIAEGVVMDKQDATCIYMFKYVGDADKADMYFLKGIKNMQPTLASGWSEVKRNMQPEEWSGANYNKFSIDATVPTDAVFIAFMIGVQDEQSPMDIYIKDFHVDTKTPFSMYDTKGFTPIGGSQLKYNNEVAQFHTGRKRWTINKSKTYLPFGEKKDGNAPAHLKVEQDDEARYYGELVLEKIGDYTIRVYVNLFLGESGQAAGSTTNFWVEDVDGNKIPDSDAPETILKAGDKVAHAFNWEFQYSANANDELRLAAQSTLDDGAYVQTTSNDAVGTLVNFKVI